MSNLSGRRVPSVPTLPTGQEVASYATYLEAQQAVDFLADKQFAVQHVTIVGTDLRLVERITGRLSYPRVAGAGALSGAWFGLFVGLVLSLLSSDNMSALVPAILIGVAFGTLFAVISYTLTGGKRDFTSTSQVVAGRYSVLCASESAGEARVLLGQASIGTGRPVPAPVREEPPVGPARRAASSEPPRYGQRIEDAAPPSSGSGEDAS